MRNKILFGDCRQTLKEFDEKARMCVTSPPYYGLRDYGGEDNQIGQEQTPEEFIEQLVNVFKEVKNVLTDDGTCWVNLGDSYYNYRPGKGQGLAKQTVSNTKQDLPDVCPRRGNRLEGLKEKDLIGIPWMFAFAMRADGWYLRQDIIWHKPNPMPESVRDRPTSCHEKIWLITKNKKYYYDAESIKEPIQDSSAKRLLQKNILNQKGSSRANGGMKSNGNMKAVWNRKKFEEYMGSSGSSFKGHSGYKKADGTYMINSTRNKRNVWTITTKPFKDAHFATFPKDLIEPCIKAGCPEGGVVLDPFGGSGTTGIVAALNNRNAILIELNQNYIDIANKRIDKEVGLFSG